MSIIGNYIREIGDCGKINPRKARIYDFRGWDRYGED
jgi:hypothetical protein